MFKKETKEQKIQKEINRQQGNRERNAPQFCKYDGLTLIKDIDVIETSFSETTGKARKKVRLQKYCPDWQINRQLHTEYYSAPYWEGELYTWLSYDFDD